MPRVVVDAATLEIVDASAPFAELLGVERQELIGSDAREIMSPDVLRAERLEAIRQGEIVHAVSLLHARDGSDVDFPLVAHFERRPDGGGHYVAEHDCPRAHAESRISRALDRLDDDCDRVRSYLREKTGLPIPPHSSRRRSAASPRRRRPPR